MLFRSVESEDVHGYTDVMFVEGEPFLLTLLDSTKLILIDHIGSPKTGDVLTSLKATIAILRGRGTSSGRSDPTPKVPSEP